MGFISALCSIGEYENSKAGSDEFSDIDSFIQMPVELIDPSMDSNPKAKKHSGREIRVWLNVEDPLAEQLKVLGVKKIDIADFFAGQADESERLKKIRYLYRNPAGSNAKWGYSPVYKLGAGIPDIGKGVETLAGDGAWQDDTKSRFYKLQKSTLQAFEDMHVFSDGSVEKIMCYLKDHVDEIAGHWSDKKSSYIMIFSVYEGDEFLYPANVPAFLEYFRKRFKSELKGEGICSVCGEDSAECVNFDKLFAFATFDKASFLPGLSDENKLKVFPVCQNCYKNLSEGRNAADKKFLDKSSIPYINIYVIPELLLGKVSMSSIGGRVADFIEKGITKESFLAKKVLENKDEIALHFVFWEKNQAQERLLYMIEDVPPSRLRRLEDKWKEALNSVGIKMIENDSDSVLIAAVKKIRMTLLSLAGKRQNDIDFMSGWVLDIITFMLSGRKIDVERVKSVVVSYLQGLCADPDWVRDKREFFARDILCIVDFLYRVNEEV